MARIDRNARPTADRPSDKIKRRRAYDPASNTTPAYVWLFRFLVALAIVLVAVELIPEPAQTEPATFRAVLTLGMVRR